MLTARPSLEELVAETVELVNTNEDYHEWEVRCSLRIVRNNGMPEGDYDLEILGIEPDDENKIIYLNVAFRD